MSQKTILENKNVSSPRRELFDLSGKITGTRGTLSEFLEMIGVIF